MTNLAKTCCLCTVVFWGAASLSCDACSLRHQRLSKSQETREQERRQLKEIYESSSSDEQAQDDQIQGALAQ